VTDSTRQPKKRLQPVRADLSELFATSPGAERILENGVLCVRDDNFRWVPDSSIDLVLTDPPFNIARDTNFHTYANNTINSYRFDEDKGWDTYTPKEFVDLMGVWSAGFQRVLRPGGSFAIFCADTYVSHLIDALRAAGLNPRRTLTWRKPNAVPINRASMMMSSCEYVVVGVKGSKATFNSDVDLTDMDGGSPIEQVLVADKVASVLEKSVRDAVARLHIQSPVRASDVEAMVRFGVASGLDEAVARVRAMYVDDDEDVTHLRGCVPNHVSFNSKSGARLHPTEKPVALLSYLMALLSNPGDVVLDPFGGSGSTGESSMRGQRLGIIVERNEEFYSKLTGRLRALELPVLRGGV
jgi:DNA modification methylase